MAVKNGNPASYFGRQLKKERVAHGLTLPELSRRIGRDAGLLSKIENGKRPPSERLAAACDEVFPERHGWFLEYYEEIRGWSEVPASLKNWGDDYEIKASTLHVWCPSIVTGLLQTPDYARALLATLPGSTPDGASQRLSSRIERQRRILGREDPPVCLFLVDELALYRRVGSAEVMAGQLAHLIEIAARPNITVQVMPAVEHNANASALIIADGRAAYAEHVVQGGTYTDDQTVSSLAARFDSLRAECYRLSESTALLERVRTTWASGASPLTATGTAGTA